MSSETNKAVVRRYVDEYLNRNDAAAAAATLADGLVFHDPLFPEPLRGRQAFMDFVTVLRAGFPDMQFQAEDTVAEGDRVVLRWTLRGTHRGEFNGVPASGKPVVVPGIDIFRFADGTIAEGWVQADVIGMLQQIGAMPAPGG